MSLGCDFVDLRIISLNYPSNVHYSTYNLSGKVLNGRERISDCVKHVEFPLPLPNPNIKEQRQLKPPKLINKKQIIEYYTQQNGGVQKFGSEVAKKLIRMVNGKEVTPQQSKLGTTTNKQFIFDMSKDIDYNLLKGKNPFFMTAEKLEEMMKNTPVNFTF